MIQQAERIVQKFIDRNWKKSLIDGFKDAHSLLEYLNIDPKLANLSTKAQQQFKTVIPHAFANRIEKENLNDPLLKQVLATKNEELTDQRYTSDPLSEKNYNPLAGLLHKYHSRVLLIAHTACAIHCRYCFRRNFNYQTNIPGTNNWLKVFDYINQDSSIEEVILSGGDPLLNSNQRLAFFIEHIQAIKHVKRLRIHSRIPIVLPERITPELLTLLTSTTLKVILVIHSNHPNELDHEVETVLKASHQYGILNLNQSTLLKGINDNAKILHQLSSRLIECQSMPYYIHLLDKVSGTTHFDLSIAKAQSIIKELSEISSGFMVPKLTQEVPGYPSKKCLPII
ncbi:EF-P beta-lysylation protein EpmB [Thiotrichales bacterium 19S3-7]|nr:EF-P beta-lysylation protein EpmB [Thiotrichales bacterium 19S3-7]MCF6801223.1 EF-P beta-lysylation protein EpmB [Thiotrichales bacterium 19S3-11]